VRRSLRCLVFLLLGCAGPEAPDAAVCQDVVTRLCRGPVCESVTGRLSVDAATCQETLLARTGCGRDSFAFETPSRVQFLDCRVPLLRQGASQSVRPSCADVDELFLDCPDVVRFFGGTP
jgi:hypothetical protein